MGLIVTPGQLKDQGEFYHQLATMTTAGVTIVQAVDMLRRNAPNRKLAGIANQMMEHLVRGDTFTNAMRATGRKLPEFDVALIEAGEASGRLDQCFKLLGDFYDERGRLASKVISQLMYPVFMFHAAVLIFPTSMLVGMLLQGQGTPFLVQKLSVLLPVYALLLFLSWSLKSERSRVWRGNVERFFSVIPVIRTTQTNLAMARLCAALEALINAGVTIIEAWDLAARASASQRIMRAVAAAKPRLQAGELPSEAIASQRIYPELFVSSYRTGEVSGQLDDALRRLYRYYLETATTSLQRLAEWMPKFIYIAVLIGIGYQIVSFYQGYFGEMNKVLGP
jgi:type II secretory pathway component PulF